MNALNESENYEYGVLWEIMQNLIPTTSFYHGRLWTLNERLRNLNDCSAETLMLKRYFELKTKIQTFKLADKYLGAFGTSTSSKMYTPTTISVRV